MRKIRLALTLLLATAAAGCDQQALQDTFEQDARRVPAGFTETDDDGRTLAADPDDWRTSPAFGGRLTVRPAYPNPSRNGRVFSLEVTIPGFDGPRGGLSLITTDANGRPIRLADLRDAQPGAYVLTFSPLSFGTRGLRRVYLYDGLTQLASYGDVMIE